MLLLELMQLNWILHSVHYSLVNVGMLADFRGVDLAARAACEFDPSVVVAGSTVVVASASTSLVLL